jgi:alanyl-tRNA synthetase
MVDQLKDKLQSGVVVLATVADDKVSLVAGVTKDLTRQIKAGDLAGHVASQIGGKGGGRPDMTMGGGTDASKLAAALQSVSVWMKDNIKD